MLNLTKSFNFVFKNGESKQLISVLHSSPLCSYKKFIQELNSEFLIINNLQVIFGFLPYINKSFRHQFSRNQQGFEEINIPYTLIISIHFKQQQFYFKMKLITYLKPANRVTHTHLVLHTTFQSKQMISLSGLWYSHSFTYIVTYL